MKIPYIFIRNHVMVFVITIFIGYLSISDRVYAHSGDTVEISGCHTCYTNCEYYNLTYGQYHCHSQKPIICPPFSQWNYYAKECMCAVGFVKTDGMCVTYNYSCNKKLGTFSFYDGLKNVCACLDGYVIFNGICTSYNTLCKNQLGSLSRYNRYEKKCECNSDNIIDPTTNKCTSAPNYCHHLYGSYESWDSIKKSCVCDYPFIFHDNQCITKLDYCREVIGIHSYANLKNECVCKFGYHLEDNTCVRDDYPSPISKQRNTIDIDNTTKSSVTPTMIETITETNQEKTTNSSMYSTVWKLVFIMIFLGMGCSVALIIILLLYNVIIICVDFIKKHFK